jgi:hypothetical protein
MTNKSPTAACATNTSLASPQTARQTATTRAPAVGVVASQTCKHGRQRHHNGNKQPRASARSSATWPHEARAPVIVFAQRPNDIGVAALAVACRLSRWHRYVVVRPVHAWPHEVRHAGIKAVESATKPRRQRRRGCTQPLRTQRAGASALRGHVALDGLAPADKVATRPCSSVEEQRHGAPSAVARRTRAKTRRSGPHL